MERLYEKCALGNIILKNRFVRSATWEGMCDGTSAPTEKLISLYEELADGDVGLIITGYAFVRKDGQQLAGKMGIHDDALLPRLKEMVGRVHGRGSKIACQLVHAGGRADGNLTGEKPLAPSTVMITGYTEVPRELTKGDIHGIVKAFGDAAARAKEAGFDGVELHGAHGYLISQFLSPLSNLREDEYGGSFTNRARFLMEVYRVVRERVGEDYTVFIKLNSDDFEEGGFTADDSREVAKMLDKEGINGIELSGGTPASGERSPARTGINSPEKEAYHREYAARIKRDIDAPVILVGGLRSPSVVKDIFESDHADFFSLSRPFIREPRLVTRWMDGDESMARCISCNGCFAPGLKEGGIYCVVEKKRVSSS